MYFKRIGFLLVFFAFGVSSIAQQLDVYSQFLHTGLDYNPAFAGAQNFYSAKIQYKRQFSAYNNSPYSSMFTFDMPFGETVGGAILLKQSNFYGEQVTMMSANTSYRIKTNTGEVGFGLRLGMNQRQISYSNTVHIDPNQGTAAGTYNSYDFGAGIQYRDQETYMSLSMINGDESLSGNATSIPRDASRNFVGVLAGRFFVSEDVDMVLGAVGNYVKDLPMDIHLNSSLVIYDFAWIGATYRSLSKQMSLQVGVATGHALNIGYSYDWGYSQIYTYSNATHELFLAINFVGKRSFKELNQDITPIMFLEKKKKK